MHFTCVVGLCNFDSDSLGTDSALTMHELGRTGLT